MMTSFLWPAIASLVLVLTESLYMKRKNDFRYYLRFFLIILSISLFFFIMKAEARELKINLPIQKMYCLSNEEWIKYDTLYHDHLKNGHMFFKRAQNRCTYIPKKSDRERAKQLFRVALVTVVSLSDWRIVIGNLIVSLGEYGIDVYDEYMDMETDLRWAEYHFEMSLFYLDIIIRSGLNPSH